jgi:hypothetical protein
MEDINHHQRSMQPFNNGRQSMITNNVSSSGDFQIQNHIYAQDESKLTHYGLDDKGGHALLSESGLHDNSPSI